MERSSRPHDPWLTSMMNPIAPALSLFTPEQLAGFMRENVNDPVGQTIADFIVVTRMRGCDFVCMPQKDLEVLSKGLPAVTELLASFQALTVIPSPRPVRRIQDIFPGLSISSSTNSAEQLTSEASDESNYWSSRSSSLDSLPSVEPKSSPDDNDHDISSRSANTPFPLLSPQASPLRPAQLMTDLSVHSDLIAHHDDFAFYSVDDDELRSLYPVFITPPIATVYQEPAAHETADVSLQDSPVNDPMRPPTLASINDPSPSTSSSTSHQTDKRISHFSTNTLTSNDVVPDISQLEEIDVSESEWPDNISTPDVHILNKDASSVAVGNDVDAFSDEPQDLPSLDLGDACPRTVTIHDHTEPSSPFLYNSHDNLPALALPFSGDLSLDSPHHPPIQTVTPHQVEIIDIRPWNLTSKPPSLSILFPISLEGSSWGRSGGSAGLNPTDLTATQSLCSTTSTAASFFALQVPRDWLSEDPEQIDESPGSQVISRFRHNFSDRTGPLSPIHGDSDDEVDGGEIGSLDLERGTISPSLPLNIPSCSLLDDDEISPLLFSPPSLPTRPHINDTSNETLHNRKLFLDTTERTLWPSGSVAYHRRRALSSPTVVKRALKIPSGSAVASPNVASPLSGLSATNSRIDRKPFLESPTTKTPNIWSKQLRKQLRSLGTSHVRSPRSLKRTQSLLSPRTKIEITDSRLLPIIHGPLSATERTPATTSPTFA